MRARTAITAAVCSLGLLLAGCSTEVAGSARLPSAAVGQAGGGSGSGQPGGGSGSESGSESEGAPTPPTGLGDLQSLLGQVPGAEGAPTPPTGLGDLQSLLGQVPGAEDAPALPTDLGDLGFDGSCLTLTGVALSASLLLLGPSMGGAPLTKADVDSAFSAVSDPPDEIRPALDKLHQLLLSAVGQPAEKVQQLLDSEEFTDATDQLSTYMESACGGT